MREELKAPEHAAVISIGFTVKEDTDSASCPILFPLYEIDCDILPFVDFGLGELSGTIKDILSMLKEEVNALRFLGTK